MIYIASDHGGYELKNTIVDYLNSVNIEVTDIGPNELNPTDDYPDFAIPLAQKVAENESNKGILICRNGVGMCIAANKVPGIRCGISWDTAHAISSRRDDNTNVLSLPADYISSEDAIKVIEKWLNTDFSQDIRHIRRLKKVHEIEK